MISCHRQTVRNITRCLLFKSNENQLFFFKFVLIRKVVTMSQVRLFSLIGDSNIRRHVNKTSCRTNPDMRAAQIIACGHFGIFDSSLKSVRSESSVVILSCLTNFIARVTGPATVSHRVDPMLQDIKTVLFEFCDSRPEVSFMVSPPMYRVAPLWYREGLPEILTLFSQVFAFDHPSNLHVLPSFPTPDYDDSGIHLTPYSGLEFIMHLFDASGEVLERLTLPDSERAQRSTESTRVLEDRMMAIEQDHRRLNRVVEDKIANDAEDADYRENERFEDFFVITGLPRIGPELVGKAWQVNS